MFSRSKKGKKIADEDNSDGMWVLVWDEYDSNSFVCEYSGFSVKYDMINDELYVQSNENFFKGKRKSFFIR